MPGAFGAPSDAVAHEAGDIMKAGLAIEASSVGTRGRRSRLPELWHFATEYVVDLPLGAALALIWANADPERYYRVVQAAGFLVNDVAMVAFFGLITKEIVEATAPGGVLTPWRRAALPLAGALGIAIVPLLLFGVLVRVFEEPMLVRGWTSLLAVDLALGYLVTRVLFGGHWTVPFFLVLAIGANGLGFIALAVAEPIREVRLELAVPLMMAALSSAILLRQRKVKSFWPYVGLGGGLSWSALFFGGLHPALALLPIVPFLPHAAKDPGFFVDAPHRATDALNRFEVWCRRPAQVALFCFGLVNAGVPLGALEPGVWGFPLAALLGKPIGLLIGVALGTAFGLHLPRGAHWRDLVPLGFISAAGFTMALFFAASTIGPGQLLAELQMGALLSAGGCIVAVAVARVLRVGRFARRTQVTHKNHSARRTS
jgi:NhaA family Na+:H+ antiporter